MPVPMRYDAAVRLCGRPLNEGSPVSIRQMLLSRFAGIQGARAGTFADRERVYLTAQGSRAGGSRHDLWADHLSSSRPFTDGMALAASLPAVVAQAFVRPPNDRYVGVVVAAGSYSFTAG